jgi:hypothetical protein
MQRLVWIGLAAACVAGVAGCSAASHHGAAAHVPPVPHTRGRGHGQEIRAELGQKTVKVQNPFPALQSLPKLRSSPTLHSHGGVNGQPVRALMPTSK